MATVATGCLKESLGHCPTCSVQCGTNTQKQVLPSSVGPEFVKVIIKYFWFASLFYTTTMVIWNFRTKAILFSHPQSLVTQSPPSQLLMGLNVWTNQSCVPWTGIVWAFCRRWQCHPCSSLLICQHDFYQEEQKAEFVNIVDYRPTNELHGKGYRAEAYHPWEFSCL